MSRKKKTLGELEEMLLARLRELPNGERGEGVNIVMSDREDGDPGVGVSWNGTGANMRPLIGHAIAYGSVLVQQYQVIDDPKDEALAHATSSI